VKEYADSVDSLMFCLSKGLGAPIGSILAGPADFVGRARNVRSIIGGGMRQVGLIAAAGVYALTHNVERLAEDHRRCKTLAEGLSKLPGVDLELNRVETNMTVFRLDDAKVTAEEYIKGITERSVLGYEIEPGLVRLVTHLDIDDEDVERALVASQDVLNREER
jgi:threonine aldolase